MQRKDCQRGTYPNVRTCRSAAWYSRFRDCSERSSRTSAHVSEPSESVNSSAVGAPTRKTGPGAAGRVAAPSAVHMGRTRMRRSSAIDERASITK